MIEQLIAFSIIGLVTGILNALLGIGGGIIVIPALFFVLTSFHVTTPSLIHVAIGTSLASMTFSTLSASIFQMRHKHVLYRPLALMALFAVGGALLGSFLSTQTSGAHLKKIFGLFEILVSIYYFFKTAPHKGHLAPRFRSMLLFLGAFLIGVVSAYLGIGGGIFVTPLLLVLGFPIRNSIGTASCMSFLITATAALNHFFLSQSDSGFMHGSIYLPAWITIACFAVIGAPIGVHLLKHMAEKHLRRGLALLLALAGIALLFH